MEGDAGVDGIAMLALGSLAFASPWLLRRRWRRCRCIWWLLRVTPPAPRRIALSGDPAAARAGAARGDAGADAAVADPAAHAAGRAGHPRARPPAAQSAGAPRRRRADACSSSMTAGPRRATGRRRQAALAELLAEAEREDRQVVLVTTAPPAADEPAPPLAPGARRRCARGGSGAAAQTMAGRPAGRARPPRSTLRCLTRRSAVWLSDGIADDGGDQALAAYLAERGSLRYLTAQPADAAASCSPPGDAEANDRRRSRCARCRHRRRVSFRCGRAATTARLLARAGGDDRAGGEGRASFVWRCRASCATA